MFCVCRLNLTTCNTDMRFSSYSTVFRFWCCTFRRQICVSVSVLNDFQYYTLFSGGSIDIIGGMELTFTVAKIIWGTQKSMMRLFYLHTLPIQQIWFNAEGSISVIINSLLSVTKIQWDIASKDTSVPQWDQSLQKESLCMDVYRSPCWILFKNDKHCNIWAAHSKSNTAKICIQKIILYMQI